MGQVTANEIYQFDTEKLVEWIASSMPTLSATVGDIRTICAQVERGLSAINKSLQVMLYDGDKPLKIYATLISYFFAPFLEKLFLPSSSDAISFGLSLAQKGLNNYFKHPGCLTLPEAELAQKLRETIEAIVKNLEEKDVMLKLLRPSLGIAIESNEPIRLESEQQIEPLILHILSKIQTDCDVDKNIDLSVSSEKIDKSSSEHTRRASIGLGLFSKQILVPAASFEAASFEDEDDNDDESKENKQLIGSGVH